MITVVGFDPGLRKTGFAVVRDEEPFCLVDSGVIAAGASAGLNQRLARIFKEARLLLKKYHTEVVALEEVYFANNPQSTLKIGLVRGILMAAALELDLDIESFSPAEVKMSVSGRGNASKRQVQYMTAALAGLPRTIPEDSADALAVCFCCLAHRKQAARGLARRVTRRENVCLSARKTGG